MRIKALPFFGRMVDPTRDIVSEIRKSRRLGADYVEIPIENPEGIADIARRKTGILSELRKRGMFCTMHMAYWAELGSQFEAVRDAWIAECKNAIEAASFIHTKKFLVHARIKGMGVKMKGGRDNIIGNFVSSYKHLESYAKRHGMILVIENEGVSYDKNLKADDIMRIMRNLKHAGLAIDIGHLFLENSNSGVANLLSKLGPRAKHMHFSDNHGNDDEHLPIGKGNINYRMVACKMKRMGYKETITLEIFNGGDKGFVSSLKKIKGMWNS